MCSTVLMILSGTACVAHFPARLCSLIIVHCMYGTFTLFSVLVCTVPIAAWYRRTGTAAPVGAPTRRRQSRYPVILRFVPSGSRLGLWQHRLRGVQGGQRPPCSGCVVVSPASVALARRPLHARCAVLHDLDAAVSRLTSQVGFAAAVAHTRLRLSRLELIGGSGRTAGRYASAARAFISPTAFEHEARGGALGAGGGRVGFAGGGLL